MPIMNVHPDEPGKNTWEVLSIFTHPNNEDDRKSFKCNTLVNDYIECMKERKDNGELLFSFSSYTEWFSSHAIEIDFAEDEVEILERALSYKKNDDNNLSTKRSPADIVGVLMFWHYGLFKEGIKDISMNKTIFIGSKILNISGQTIRNYLNNNRSILHMCCALYAVGAEYSTNDAGLDIDNVLCPQNINRFISLSEHFRLFFESKRDEITNTPILKSEISWKAPDSFRPENLIIVSENAFRSTFAEILASYPNRNLPN